MNNDTDDLAALVDEAQAELLLSSDTVSTDEVMQWIEGTGGRQLAPQDRHTVVETLAGHPRLVPAALGTVLWKRGVNQGPLKRNPIGSGRR